MDISILQEAGLNESEIKIYIGLLELGSTTTGPIIKKTGLANSLVYHSLDSLLSKGLVSYVIKAERKYFEASKPSKLLDIIEERKKELERNKEKIKKILPELLAKQKLKAKQEVTIYEGAKGIQSVLMDILRTLSKETTIYVIGAEGRKYYETLKYFFPHWTKQRVKKKIMLKMIVYKEQIKYIQKIDNKTEFIETKLISEDFKTPASTIVYADKVAIQIFEDEPAAILIQSKSVATAYKNYFNLLWKIAK